MTDEPVTDEPVTGQPVTGRLDPVIHPMNRLQICAALAAAQSVEFSVIQQHLGLSASALSKQVSALVDAGYVAQKRGLTDSRRLWLSLTAAGRLAYQGHVTALRAIIADGTVK